MNDEELSKLEIGRRLARRWMAWVSLGILSSIIIIVFGMILFSPEREAVATGLAAASPLLTGLSTIFASVIIGYLGVSVAEKIFKKKD